jgi:hypothetical protein
MAALAIGDVLQVIQTWDTPLASVAQNVWHLLMKSGAGADSDDILPAVLTQQQVAFANIAAELNNGFSVTLHELRLWDAVAKRFDGVDSQTASVMIGTSATDYEPHGVAALGRILTAGARRQGRSFIPGMTDAQVSNGVLSAGMEASLASYLATFDTDISVTGGLFGWCTFNIDVLSPIFETTSLAIQTVIANSLPSYLGKRKPGVGL